MTDDDILSLDADLSPIGDRVASSGWALPYRVGVVKAEASGMTEFANGTVAYGAPHSKMSLVISGIEAEGRQVVLDDDYLVGEGPIVGVVEPRRAVLDDLLRLAKDPSDAAILAYASQYGMLGLRPRDRAPANMAFPNLPWVGEQIAPFIGYQAAPGILREPLGLWRRVSAEIAAVYAIAGNLRTGRLVERAAWQPLRGIIELPLGEDDKVDDTPSGSYPAFPGIPAVPTIPVRPTTLEGQRQALAAVVGTWLALGAVRPAIAWGGPGQDDPLITLGATTLFGGLVLELLVAVGGQAGLAICTGCGMPYIPGRRPPSGAFGAPRATYCPDCRGRNVAQNEAARRWRVKHPDYFRRRRTGAPEPDAPADPDKRDESGPG
jgi:hypothetical protein